MIFPVAVARLLLVVLRLPESEVIVFSVVRTLPESELMLVSVERIRPERVFIVPERAI